jgi:hypothetical protein
MTAATVSEAQRRRLVPALLVYAAASLFHHVHNAVNLAAYPGMPRWLSPAQVYVAWGVTTSVGVLGYLLLRAGRVAAGLVILLLYAVLGFAGLEHYLLAPMPAHSPMMNLSIALEVVTALVVLLMVAARLVPLLRGDLVRTR